MEPDETEAFFDHIITRSGLLIGLGARPGGEEIFSFVHLSMQEFFAAIYLRNLFTSVSWLRNPEALNITSDGNWRESILFLYEMLSDERSDWQEVFELITEQLFPASDNLDSTKAFLLSDLIRDPHSGFNFDVESYAIRILEYDKSQTISLETRAERLAFQIDSAVKNLFESTRLKSDWLWKKIASICNSNQVGHLDIAQVNFDLPPGVVFHTIDALSLDRCYASGSFNNLPKLVAIYAAKSTFGCKKFLENRQWKQLQFFDSDVELGDWLGAQKNLEQLGLNVGNRATEMEFVPANSLPAMPSLTSLHLHDSKFSKIDLAEFSDNLESICLARSEVQDFEFLRKLERLERITYFHGNESEVTSFVSVAASLKNLKVVSTPNKVLEEINYRRLENGLAEVAECDED